MTLRAWIVGLAAVAGPALGQPSLDSLAVRVRDASREYAFTNKMSAFYYGESNDVNRSGWQGFNVSGFKFLDDYRVTVDGVPLDRKSSLSTVYPDHLQRTYPNGVTEQLRVADSVALFAVMITSSRPVIVEISPLFTDARNDSGYILTLSEGSALLARRRHLLRTAGENYPVWLGIHGEGFKSQRRPMATGNQFSPLTFVSGRGKTHILAFAVADDQLDAQQLAGSYEANAAAYFGRRRSRMETLLASSAVSTGDERFDRALAWAKLSLDALIMNQGSRGIFAGLPWFNNYWGRDTYISLPGAALVTCRFPLAKEILRSFAQAQMTDSLSTDYGRIPNIVTTTEKAYNTADGTPRFVMMAKEYVERSGDSTFMLEVYPDVIRSIEGTLKYHADARGFLVHGDAETWMDAVGPDGPWSPRGNRANDVQALWAGQLRAGIWFATRIGDPVSARRWEKVLRSLETNFPISFISHGLLADHVRSDGSRNMQIRPNQIFCGPLLSDSMQARVTRVVTTQLTYRYGVASLSQDDSAFHPYHQHPPFYPKDAAYHNGTVWTWLQGALISNLCRFGEQDLAWDLTSFATHQILDRGAVGTLPELLDAVPIPPATEPRMSGTFSQAWSLAEFVRNFYDDYLGLRVDRLSHTIALHPHLPKALQNIHATLDIGGGKLDVDLHREKQEASVSLRLRNTKHAYVVTLDMPTGGNESVQSEFSLTARSAARWKVRDTHVTLTSNGKALECQTRLVHLRNFDSLLKPLSFLLPVVRPGLRALRGPRYPLLPHSIVKSVNPKAALLYDVADPAGDDLGDGQYRYHSIPASSRDHSTSGMSGSGTTLRMSISSSRSARFPIPAGILNMDFN